MSWSYTIDYLTVLLGVQRPGDSTRFSRVSTDTRTLQEGDVFFALSGPNFDAHDFVKIAFEKGAAAAVVTEPVPGGVSIVVPDTLEALQLFAAEHRKHFKIPLFAITGSCGKTTTKDFAAAVLGSRMKVVKTVGNLNNEVGCPHSLLAIDAGTEMAIIEMGANHPGEIARLCTLAKPTESAITMIGAAHLEGFGTIEDVARAKGEIAAGLPARGTVYGNVDDPRCRAIGDRFAGRRIRIGSRSNMSVAADGDVIIEQVAFGRDGEMNLELAPIGRLRLPLRARAHATNVALAVAVGLQHGVTEFEGPLREACASSSRFKTRSVDSWTVIDDTYNANPSSMEAALQTLGEWETEGARIAVLGAMLELGPESAAWHRRVGEAAAGFGVDALIARGPDADAMVAGSKAAGLENARVIEDHNAIAEAVRAIATPGSVILCKGSRGMRMEKVIAALSGDHAAVNAGSH